MGRKEELMKRTIELAISAIEKGNTPFGAIVVKDGEIIAEAANETTSSTDRLRTRNCRRSAKRRKHWGEMISRIVSCMQAENHVRCV